MKKTTYCSLAICLSLVLVVVYTKPFAASQQDAPVGAQSALRPADLPPSLALTKDLTIDYDVQTLAYGKQMQKRRVTAIFRPNGDTAGVSPSLDVGFIGDFHKVGSGKIVFYDSKSRVAFEESVPGFEARPRMNGRYRTPRENRSSLPPIEAAILTSIS